MNRTVLVAVTAVAVVVLGSACSKKEDASTQNEAEREYMVMGEYVNPQDSLPYVRYYADSLVSLNDRCAVRRVKLNPGMPPIYVNGRPIGFC